jgi:histidine triad (HIT) family protein
MATCVFCDIARGVHEPEGVALRTADVVAFMSRGTRPRNLGHTCVIPRAHVETIYDLPDDLAGPLMRELASVARAVKAAFRADGVSIRQNNEVLGGQSVPHLHFHVVPRFADDEVPSWGEIRHTTPDERADLAGKLSAALAGSI